MNRWLLLLGIAIGLLLNLWATSVFLDTGEQEIVAMVLSGMLIGFCLTLFVRALKRGRKS